MKLSKLVPVLALSVALGATLAAQASKAPAAPESKAQKTATKTEDKAKKTAAKMTAADLPQAVRDAVMKAHPNGTISSVSTAMHGADTIYNVHVTDAGKASTMALKADGTMANAKAKTESKAKTTETKAKGK